MINKVMWDKHAKEFVLITNMICTLDHSSPAAFQASHQGGQCQMVPHEARALRVIAAHDDQPVCGWTYRRVNHQDLQPLQPGDERKAELFLLALNHHENDYFRGRV